MKTFEEILASVPVATFLDESWGKEPRIVEGPSDKFAHLFDWGLLNTMLEADFLRPPRIRLIQDGERIDQARYVREGRSAQSLDAIGLTQALRDGAALVLDNVDALFPPVRGAAEALESFFGTTCQVNMYVGWRASKGFDVHWDTHDVIVLQVEGTKAWQVWKPTMMHPLELGSAPEPEKDAELYWEGTVTAGDLIYLPRGWWHRAEALDETSVHLTMGVRRPTATDYVLAVFDKVNESPDMRASLPPSGADVDPLVFAELARSADQAPMQQFLDNQSAGVWTRPSFDFPDAMTTEPSTDITGASQLKLAWTHGLSFEPGPDGRLRVQTVSLSTTCSAALQRSLERLSGLGFTSLDDVRAGLDDRKLRRELTFLISSLVMKGAVVIAPPD